ncbi:hypothetical protein GWI33_005964 [Rhynchophorus ferrugineus]|uniref:Uncharacterized protein n=1 Tax=Rhynchophorus ferrugineus TaxID=354439 RepID=A0A834IV48_RHYFE|nr:hypothetical protein GWI33_005964 [Rhynchophorus ferrugineus]
MVPRRSSVRQRRDKKIERPPAPAPPHVQNWVVYLRTPEVWQTALASSHSYRRLLATLLRTKKSFPSRERVSRRNFSVATEFRGDKEYNFRLKYEVLGYFFRRPELCFKVKKDIS